MKKEEEEAMKKEEEEEEEEGLVLPPPFHPPPSPPLPPPPLLLSCEAIKLGAQLRPPLLKQDPSSQPCGVSLAPATPATAFRRLSPM